MRVLKAIERFVFSTELPHCSSFLQSLYKTSYMCAETAFRNPAVIFSKSLAVVSNRFAVSSHFRPCFEKVSNEKRIMATDFGLHVPPRVSGL